jgi:hypothetical protein
MCGRLANVKPDDLTSGLYRLTRTIDNARPDRRVRHDWRALPTFPEGKVFRIERITGNPNAELKGDRNERITICSEGGWHHQEIDLRYCGAGVWACGIDDWTRNALVIIAALEPIPESVYSYVDSRNGPPSGMLDDILNELIVRGRITLDDVRQAWETINAREED